MSGAQQHEQRGVRKRLLAFAAGFLVGWASRKAMPLVVHIAYWAVIVYLGVRLWLPKAL